MIIEYDTHKRGSTTGWSVPLCVPFSVFVVFYCVFMLGWSWLTDSALVVVTRSVLFLRIY